MENNVLIITCNKYPNGNAGAVRQHVFAKAFIDLGYSITLIGMGESTNFQYKEYDGVRYISLRDGRPGVFRKINNRLLYKNRLKKVMKDLKPQAVLVVDLPLNAVSYVRKYSQKNGIRLIHDSVEWYSKEEFKLGWLDMSYIHKDLLNRFWISKYFRVAAISEYLNKYFLSKGNKSCRIPFVLDVKNIEFEKKITDDKIVIVYAGTIGKKDYFDAVIRALNEIDKQSRGKIELRIIGCDTDGFVKSTGIARNEVLKLGGVIKFLGRVPREKVIENLKEADFTILIRPENLRYAEAGFPTKVTESMSYGTPVIANITSDLGEYLSDNYNAVVVGGNSAEDVREALCRVLKMDKEQILTMCKNARYTAENELDYRKFSDDLKELLQ